MSRQIMTKFPAFYSMINLFIINAKNLEAHQSLKLPRNRGEKFL